jgi:cell wall-associated NlpC family hydrolase
MSADLNQRMVAAAEARMGCPYVAHDSVADGCDGGIISSDLCMTVGLDNNGYDCGGLVVASLADILDITLAEYPTTLRHHTQMAELAAPRHVAQIGDIWLQRTTRGQPAHVGVFTYLGSVVHANNTTNTVSRQPISRQQASSVIPLACLVEQVLNYD